MIKDEVFLNAAAALGDEWTLAEEVISGMERLTCRLYGSQRVNDVNECRYNKLISVCCPDDLNIINPTKKFDTAFIPPAKTSLIEHCKRVNFEVGKWKRSHVKFPIIPSPFNDNGWWKDENDVLQPVWYQGDMLPQTIVNELPETETDESEEVEEEEEQENAIDEEDFSEFIAELFNESDDEEEFEGFSDIDV